MFRIGEFSKLTKVSIRMLRYYDECGVLKPAKVDDFTGYRMYSAEQIPKLQKVILLRDSKFKISEIKDIISTDSSNNVLQELENKKALIEEEIKKEEQRIDRINKAIKEIKKDNLNIHCNVNFKKVDKMLILSLRDIIPSYFHEGVLWKRLCEFMEDEGISEKKDIYNNVALYHDIEHKDENVDVEVGMILDKPIKSNGKFKCREVEGIERAAYAMVYGPYENLAKGYESLAYYLESNNEEMAEKPSRQICHIGACDTNNPEEYLTEIQIPLK